MKPIRPRSTVAFTDTRVDRPSRPLLGITLVISALLVFAIQDAIVKDLTSRYPVIELLTLRIVLVLVCLVGAAAMIGGRAAFRTRHWKPMCLRGVLAFAAFYNYYVALTWLPLADAATVLMSAPLFVTLLSVPLLGERVGRLRWCAVIAGFVAVVIMLDPGAALFSPISLLPLGSALCYALIPILTRSIRTDESSITINLYTTISYAVVCVVFSLFVHALPDPVGETGIWASIARRWSWPSLVDGYWIAVTSVLFTVGLYAITHAYRVAVVSALAPFEYSYLVWATGVGYLAFGDVPGVRTLAAGAVIAVCGIAIAMREHRGRAIES